MGALPQTENLTLGQGFSAKARDETVEDGFISFSSEILTLEVFTQIKGRNWSMVAHACKLNTQEAETERLLWV